jgi:heme oxygenase (mycobilin-producing)
MIAVANRIYVKQDYHEAFEQAFRNRAHLVDTMPGFIFNQVLRPSKEGEPYVVLTYWETHTDFQNWVRSDAFKQGHAKSGSLPKEAFFDKNKLEIHQVIQDSRNPGLVPEERLELTEVAHG